MSRDEYDDAVRTFAAPLKSMTGIADSFTHMFPVSGAAVSTIGDLLGNETLSASNDVAARIDELQFDLGEGPCWDALATGRPVLEPDVRALPPDRWPAFSPAIAQGEVAALFAFPMIVGHLQIGAVDLYASEPASFAREHIQQATRLTDLLGRNILRMALLSAAEEPDSHGTHSRRRVHQATGMVLAQLEISAEEAGLVIQGHAFATGRSMMSVADDIITGHLSFHSGPAGIEEQG